MRSAATAARPDLEAWELAIRGAVLAAGAKGLGRLLTAVGRGRRAEAVLCGCGEPMESRGLKGKELLTILGPVSYARTRFYCGPCQQTRYPGDEELDIVGTSRSPGLRRMMARAGSRSTFKEGRDDLQVYAGIKASAKDVERVAERVGEQMEQWNATERTHLCEPDRPVPPEKPIPLFYISYDGTGVPMTKAELVGRPGKQADGSARTREAKLGCIFTQSGLDEEGNPVRDDDSTSFVGAIEPAGKFGWRLYAEAVRRGLEQAQRVVILVDGAEWIRQLAEFHFPGATQIVDLYHAKQHVSDLCKLLFPHNERQTVRQRLRWWTLLEAGQIGKLIAQAQRHLPAESRAQKQVEGELNYLRRNQERMRYADFRRQGLFVGSGVIEAGCKTVIGQRLKQSGMEWSLRGANAIISLRCMIKSGRLEEYWEARAA